MPCHKHHTIIAKQTSNNLESTLVQCEKMKPLTKMKTVSDFGKSLKLGKIRTGTYPVLVLSNKKKK